MKLYGYFKEYALETEKTETEPHHCKLITSEGAPELMVLSLTFSLFLAPALLVQTHETAQPCMEGIL